MFIISVDNDKKIKLPAKVVAKMNIQDGDSLIGEMQGNTLVLSLAESEDEDSAEDEDHHKQDVDVNTSTNIFVTNEDSPKTEKEEKVIKDTNDIFKGFKMNPLLNKTPKAYISSDEDIENNNKLNQKEQEDVDKVEWVNGNLVHSKPKEIKPNPKKVDRKPPTAAELFGFKNDKPSNIKPVEPIKETKPSSKPLYKDRHLPPFSKNDVIKIRSGNEIIRNWECGRCGESVEFNAPFFLNGRLLCFECIEDLKQQLATDKLKLS